MPTSMVVSPKADIDALGDYWREFVSLGQVLLVPQREEYLSFNVATDAISETISSHADYKAFEAKAAAHYQAWQDQVVEGLKPYRLV